MNPTLWVQHNREDEFIMKKGITALLVLTILILICPTTFAAGDPDGPVSTVADVIWLRPTGNQKWNITSGIGKRNLGYGSTSHHGTDLGNNPRVTTTKSPALSGSHALFWTVTVYSLPSNSISTFA